MVHRRPLLRLIAWPYAVVTALVLALWISPLDLPAAQLIDLGTFWWTLPAVALVVVAAALRDGRALLLLALPAVTWAWSYGAAFVPHTPPDVEPDLRVVSFNTYVHAPDASHVTDVAASTDADVLFLQEVFPGREEELVEAFADDYPHVQIDRSEGVGAVVVFSRFPITDVAPVGGPSERSRATSVVTLDVDGRPVQAVSLHLISPCPACGPSILERLEVESEVRSAEVGAVLDTLDPDLPAIIGGDLNSSDRGTPYRRLVGDGFEDVQRQAGEGMGFTWPADGWIPPVVRIDWVLTRGLDATEAWVDDGGASDHRPVVADLVFAGPEG